MEESISPFWVILLGATMVEVVVDVYMAGLGWWKICVTLEACVRQVMVKGRGPAICKNLRLESEISRYCQV